jgi:hypothetical protein
MKTIVALIFTLYVVLSGSAFAQGYSPDSLQIAALASLEATFDSSLAVHWDSDLGTPDIVTFGSPRAFDADPVLSATKFLRELSVLLLPRESIDTWDLIQTQQYGGVTYVRFAQKYKQIDIDGGEYVITVLKGGKILSLSGHQHRGIAVDAQPAISSTQALKIAVTHVQTGFQLKDSVLASTIAIVRENGAYYLGWKLRVPEANFPVEWMYVVEAKTGSILNRYRMILGATGQATVYQTSPCLSGTQSATLNNLSPNGFLTGTWVTVHNQQGSDAYNPNRDFRYSTGNVHFDEANAYYNASRARDYWGSYVTQPVTVWVHSTAVPNSCDSGLISGSIYLGDGCGDPAREDKVLYHEYTHFAVFRLGMDFTGVMNEPGGISEGMADFFAGDYTSRPLILDCAWPAMQRDMNNPCFADYASYNAEYISTQHNVDPHRSGQLWSACLWNLRSVYIPMSSLVMASIPSLTTSSTFLIGRQAIINQDRIQFAGAHNQTIAHYFFTKGIGYDALGVPAISGYDCLRYKQNGTWSVSVAGGSGSFAYRWYYMDQYTGGSWVALGSAQTQSRTMTSYSFDLRCDVTDNMLGITNSSLSFHVEYGCAAPKIGLEGVTPPTEYALEAIYPNPFNPRTNIKYALSKPGFIALTVYDLMGRDVVSLANGYHDAGYYMATWDASTLASGPYYIRLEVTNNLSQVQFSKTSKVLFMK